MNISREYIQATSSALIMIGVFLMITTPDQWLGVSFVCLSCWVMLFNESMLLSKVQYEMTASLESLRKKQEVEVQDLLFYLRQSELGNSPWSSLEAAKNHIQKIGYPAIITDSGGACVAVNPALYDSLGYGEDHVGKLCHGIHDTLSYGDYVQGIASNITQGKRFMHSRLIMIDSDGGRNRGTVAIMMLPDMRTAVGVWYPDDAGILKSCD